MTPQDAAIRVVGWAAGHVVEKAAGGIAHRVERRVYRSAIAKLRQLDPRRP